MQERSNLHVDSARLWDSLMAMARIGATPGGGCNRLALTDDDREARRLFARWCDAAGLSTGIDQMGNMFARRAGTDDTLPPVLLGSHLDTQPTGGRFDGVLGVLGALEVVRTLNDLGLRTRHPIEVVNWTNEEGSRFAPAMLSSGVFAGAIGLEQAHAIRDRTGVALGDALDRIGFKGTEPVGRPVHAYLELHIEQGPILEAEGIDIGVVTHGQGQHWYEIELTGFESHAGSTPMGRRRDALLGAARVVELVHRIGLAHPPVGVATVGMLDVYPGSRNVIPGAVRMTCEYRHPDAAALAAMGGMLHEGIAAICADAGLAYTLRKVFDDAPVPFDRRCVAAVRRGAQAGGYSHRDIVSGAGHDACHMARIVPSAMVFTPCVGGISHNEAETILPDWAAAGTQVLLHAALDLAELVP